MMVANDRTLPIQYDYGTMLQETYQRLPPQLQPVAKNTYRGLKNTSGQIYYDVHPFQKSPETIHNEFVSACFDSYEEYNDYRKEFFDGPATAALDQARTDYARLGITDRDDVSFGGTNIELGARLYALVRKRKPETIIETGVCNGESSLFFLLALRENATGTLHSIDYPFRADESLEEFRAETFEDYGGAAIPADKDPGWIIPDELREHWDLRVGKSQEELPRLLDELGEIDFFIHDSEHSPPCMMMEYELAYNRLVDGGLLLSDDLDWNDHDTWGTFVDVRNPRMDGRVGPGLGYLQK